jgi:hypothetical protein
MQSHYPARFERDMACTEAEWLGWLPAAIGEHRWEREPAGAVVHADPGTLHLAWHALPPRAIALVRLPRLHVTFEFDGVDDAARHAFMKRFDLYMQRGGG